MTLSMNKQAFLQSCSQKNKAYQTIIYNMENSVHLYHLQFIAGIRFTLVYACAKRNFPTEQMR